MVTEQPSARKESARPSPIPLVLPVITMLFIIQLQTQFYRYIEAAIGRII